MKRLGLSGIGVAAAASILAACGDDEAAAPTTTAAPAEPVDTDEAAPATTAAPEPSGPTQGGTLREGYNRDVSKHDPLTTNWYDPAFFAIYEAILSNDPSGATVPQFASGLLGLRRRPHLHLRHPRGQALPLRWDRRRRDGGRVLPLGAGLQLHRGAGRAGRHLRGRRQHRHHEDEERLGGRARPPQDRLLAHRQHQHLEGQHNQRRRHPQPGVVLRHRVRRRHRAVHPRGVGAGQPRAGEPLGRLSRLEHPVLREQGPGPPRRRPLDGHHGGGPAGHPARERRPRHADQPGPPGHRPAGEQLGLHSDPPSRMVGLPPRHEPRLRRTVRRPAHPPGAVALAGPRGHGQRHPVRQRGGHLRAVPHHRPPVRPGGGAVQPVRRGSGQPEARRGRLG